MSAPVLMLFGLLAPEGASPGLERALAELEQQVVRVTASRGLEVRPAAEELARPVAQARARDVAASLDVDRALLLDYVPEPPGIWLTHYARGSSAPTEIRRAACALEAGTLECPRLTPELLAALAPRSHLEIDLAGLLRERAPALSRCVRAGRRAKVAERVEGRLVVGLEVVPSGGARVVSWDPEIVAELPLGRCVERTFSKLGVGPFEGPVISLRIPIEL